jgi:hypothetical protein
MFPLVVALVIGTGGSCPDSGDSGQPTRESLVLHGIRGMNSEEVDRALAEEGGLVSVCKRYSTLRYARTGLDVSFHSGRVIEVRIHKD